MWRPGLGSVSGPAPGLSMGLEVAARNRPRQDDMLMQLVECGSLDGAPRQRDRPSCFGVPGQVRADAKHSTSDISLPADVRESSLRGVVCGADAASICPAPRSGVPTRPREWQRQDTTAGKLLASVKRPKRHAGDQQQNIASQIAAAQSHARGDSARCHARTVEPPGWVWLWEANPSRRRSGGRANCCGCARVLPALKDHRR